MKHEYNEYNEYTEYNELKPKAKDWLQAVLDSEYRNIWLDDAEQTCVRTVINRNGYYSDEQDTLNEITGYYNSRMKESTWEKYKITY